MTLENLPTLKQDIIDAQKVYTLVNLTSVEIESLLKLPAYAAEQPDYSWITRKEKREVNTVEAITSFGNNIADLFEDLIIELGKLPTQQEYLQHSLEVMKTYWDDKQHYTDTKGMPWSENIERACKNRALRTYTSQLVEFHCITSMREIFPEWNIYFSNSLDLLLGVDFVCETEKKRIYVHIFKNTSSGFKAFYRKEKRGGKKNKAGKFIKFKRNFEGDKCLMFDYQIAKSSETTQFINGHPLFRKDFLETQFLLFDKFSQIGESKKTDGKLAYLNEFLEDVRG